MLGGTVWLLVGASHGEVPAAYEVPPVFAASEELPPELLRGPHHRVREAAPSDGYMTHFTIDSDFGVFECIGRRQVEARVTEIGAIARLVEVSKGDLFAEGLKRSIEKPIDAVKNIVTKPAETVKQVPKTVGHFFSKVGSAVGNASRRASQRFEQANAEGDVGGAVADTGKGLGLAAKSAAGFELAKLETARQLGVDPYSDNRRLQEEMEKVTWAFFAGGLPLRVGAAVASGGASVALAATKAAGLPEDVYDVTPNELSLRDREALAAMGIDPATVDQVFLNPVLTASLRHGIVGALQQLPAGPGRAAVVEAAVSCERVRQAVFLHDALAVLVERHREAPYRGLATAGRLPGGITADGTLEVAAPVDFVSWSEEVAAFASRDDLPAGPRRLLLGGRPSPAAAAGLRAAGWEVAGAK